MKAPAQIEHKDSCCADDECTSQPKPEIEKDSCSDGCCEPSVQTAPLEADNNSNQKLEYRIQGMDCSSCAETLQKGISKLEGVSQVSVNFSTAKMTVAVQDEGLGSQIESQVKKLGFSAEPIESKASGQTYVIGGMDCGACAVTLEKHLRNIPAVREVSVNFSTGKMQINHDLTNQEVEKEVAKAGFTATLAASRRVKTEKTEEKPKKQIPATALAGIFLAAGFIGAYLKVPDFVSSIFYALSIVLGGYKPARSAYYAVRSKSLDMNVLMTVAAIGAAAIGEWFEGAIVVFLFSLGNTLQNRAIEKTRRSISGLMNLAPSEAWVKEGQQLIRKPVEEIAIGDVIVIKPGEKIPLDGEVVSGNSAVNQAPITGESVPVDKEAGSLVYAGTVNESGSLEVKVTKLVEDTAIARIIHMVEEAQEKKAPSQAFVDRFARIYTPIMFLLALAIMIIPPALGFGTWGEWFYRGLELLVVACPCALVISTPVAIVSAIGNAARNGVLIKGGTFLEIAGSIKAVAFDKTGTLTIGKPKVSEVIAVGEASEEELLRIAYTIEEHSKHPIASAVIEHALDRGLTPFLGEDFGAIAGKGAQATINGTEYFAGNPKLFQEWNVSLEAIDDKLLRLQNEGNTLVIIGTRSRLVGLIAVSDLIRETSKDTMQGLKRAGIHQLVMLTGDNEGTARKIAAEAGVDRYFAELLPEDKVTAVQRLQEEGQLVAMVGDGINDAPALATANLGIAMGGAGTDTAMETADIVLMADNLEKLPHTMKLSRKALQIIKQNIWFSILIKVIALTLIFPGWLTLWAAVMSDTGAALVVILNSMRLLRFKA
ncbi:heavy metal translocating P-type ATPase [Paenibacillus humicus]|uniref:heavy metal translocating P-type ATPase n=1 Tax=Paenibacillus humicus TaxID=412861 RepID=UPI003F5CC2F9